MKAALRLPSLILLVAGFVIWSSAFVALYGALSVGCAFGWDAVLFGPVSALRALLIALWLLHLAMLAMLNLRSKSLAVSLKMFSVRLEPMPGYGIESFVHTSNIAASTLIRSALMGARIGTPLVVGSDFERPGSEDVEALLWSSFGADVCMMMTWLLSIIGPSVAVRWTESRRTKPLALL